MKAGEAVVELGFGTGNEVLDLVALVGPMTRVAGIDISSGMLAVARRKLAANPPAAPIDPRVGDARSLPGGRLAVVKPGQHTSVLERTYVWMHRHFPHLVDCRPIDAPGLITAAGFRVTATHELEIWTMPVAVVVGVR